MNMFLPVAKTKRNILRVAFKISLWDNFSAAGFQLLFHKSCLTGKTFGNFYNLGKLLPPSATSRTILLDTNKKCHKNAKCHGTQNYRCPHRLSFSGFIVCTVYRNITTHGQFIVLGVIFIVLGVLFIILGVVFIVLDASFIVLDVVFIILGMQLSF